MSLPSFERTFLGIRIPVDLFYRAVKVFEAGLVPNETRPELVLADSPTEGLTSISLTVDGGKWSVTESEFRRRYDAAEEGSYFRSVFLRRGGDLNIGLWFTKRSTRVLIVGISDEQVSATATTLLQGMTSAPENLSRQSPNVHITAQTTTSNMPNPRDVMVIYGRDNAARKAIVDFLRSLDLHPLEWGDLIHRAGSGAPVIADVLDVAFETAQAAIVLLTGDDEARLRVPFLRSKEPGYECSLTPQARPNVLFEAGMAFGRYPERTILLSIGSLRPFSDISGRHLIHMSNSIEARHSLLSRLRSSGCAISESGADWHSAGDFAEVAAFSNGECVNLNPPSWFGVDEREGMRMVVCVSRWPDDPDWFWLRITVSASDPATHPLRGKVTFFLHPDYDEREMVVPVIQGEATLTLQTEGPWKVKAECAVRLQVDLSKIGVPWNNE